MREEAEEIFANALELDPSDRPAYLAGICDGRPDLMAEVQEFLRDADSAETFFDALTRGASGTSGLGSHLPSDRPDVQIGPYHLVRLIGRGGFGAVWLAEQKEPIRRMVALKLIKLGMDSEEVLRRFRAEQQALARMDHPNIARVFDAGTTPDGRPFFAMEMVAGKNITEFCDERKLSISERLLIFLQVCAAVGHAHQKGIIHRDIKPSNVLVLLEGERPVVKVIDFGIAKAIEGRLTEHSLHTRQEQVLGTPVYMSPEQAGRDGQDIDTRSDIYALGVLLYELLAGVPPFEAKTLIQAGYEEMRRIVREVDPPRPSARMTLLDGKKFAELSAARQAVSGRVRDIIPTDLDWIVMKALEKSRDRRYASADAFADDARRFLDDEPVSARPPGTWYLIGKFAKRHAVTFAVASGIGAVLVAAVFFSSWQAVRARKAEGLAEARLLEATSARALEAQAKDEAEAVAEFFREIFEMPDPEAKGRDIKIADALDASAEKIGVEFRNQPRRRGLFEETLGGTYARLGLYLQSLIYYRKALASYQEAGEENSREYSRALGELIDVLSFLGYYGEAADLGSKLIDLIEKREDYQFGILGEAVDQRNNNWFLSGRRAEALASQEALVAKLQQTPGVERGLTIKASWNLDEFRQGMGVRKEVDLKSKKDGERVVSTPPKQLYENEKARQEKLRIGLEEARLKFGHDSAEAISLQRGLAWQLGMSGQTEAGTRLMRESTQMLVAKFGDTHEKVFKAESEQAQFLWRTLQYQEGQKAWKAVLEKRKAIFGPDHLDTLKEQSHYADTLFHAGRLDEATELATETIESMQRVHGKSSVLYHTMGILSRCLRGSGQLRKSMDTLEQCAPHMPDDTFVNLDLAELQVWFDQSEAYENTRNRMLTSTPKIWKGNINRADVYERTAHLASLTPFENAEQAEGVRNLLKHAIELRSNPDVVMTRNRPAEAAFTHCLVAFRLGDDEGVQSAYEDCQRLTRGGKTISEKPIAADLIQAMSLFRRGKGEEANALFQEVTAAMTPFPAIDAELSPRPGPHPFPISSWILQREAQSFFSTSATSQKNF